MTKHPWKLVGPWYRWTRPGVSSVGRGSRPVFQKYDGPAFVADFLKDPQRSLKFTDDDFVHEVKPLPPMNPAKYNNQPRRLSEFGYYPTTTRKLFLDTHKRFYLVVCELHCDITGFPSVNRAQICDAGFVVRRRVVRNLTKEAVAFGTPIFQRIAATRSALGQLAVMQPQTQLGFMKKALAPEGELLLTDAIAESFETNQKAMLEQLTLERSNALRWATTYGVSLRLQGWKQIREGIGEWIDVDEASVEAPVEQTLPLYPLIPDPREEKHSAKGRTIYFGVAPTGSADTDEFGTARFDDAAQYEIRCFVRRYKHPPTNGGKPKCCGEVVWSLPTEVYQLASHFDLAGTNNRPVSMQLPDLKALEAQAAALPPNQLAPFRMVSPLNSNLEVTADETGKIKDHGTSSQICSFSIPLITIVATFVFKLFLPVVTLLFGLFFMLKLKFCIPPSISLSAGVAAELNATLELGLDVSVDAKLDVGTPLGNDIDAQLRIDLGDEMVDGLRNGVVPDRPGGFGPRAVADMTNSVYESGLEQNAPSLTAKLEYEAHVDAEVFA
ncbi:MAG TPA: hypothetical protein VGO56_10620 [Pyrinomonadaceae bacterium]|jgi:hypothetical protein|nr:hypothetical protein [Pyrinomonadaceae bacterium]